MKKKQKYSAAEKRAYYMGVGISAEKHGQSRAMINGTLDERVRKSLQNGIKAGDEKGLGRKLTCDANHGKKNKKKSLSYDPKKLYPSLYNDFDYDCHGNIKGEWIDGRFIPD